jgi:hypothetical protein
MSVVMFIHTTYQWIRKSVEESGRGLTWGIIVTCMAGLRKPSKLLVLLRDAISIQDLINAKLKSTHLAVTFGQTANLHQSCPLENKRVDVIKMQWNASGYNETLVWRNTVYKSEQRYTRTHNTSRLYVVSVCVILNNFVNRGQWKWIARYWKLYCYVHGLTVRALARIIGRGAPIDSITGIQNTLFCQKNGIHSVKAQINSACFKAPQPATGSRIAESARTVSKPSGQRDILGTLPPQANVKLNIYWHS